MKGKVTSSITVTDKIQKREKLLGERRRHVPSPAPDGGFYAVLKASTGVTLSLAYQTIRVDVGVELPWPCTPGSTDGLSEGFAQAYELIDQELESRTAEADTLLHQIVRKYR